MTILVTGAAGFIGMHVVKRLLERGDRVVGIDNMNDYYDVNFKKARLQQLDGQSGFIFCNSDVVNLESLEDIWQVHQPRAVIHLAAQAGVRHSIQNPRSYIDANIVGFLNILECCRHHGVDHLVYASSSSVYGANQSLPFSESDHVDHPISIYAATKKSNELMAHTYSHLFELPTTGLRFFTVYGPWGRPDMSYMLFARAIVDEQEIKIYNQGQMIRDFTYIDDVVEAVVRILNQPAQPDSKFDPKSPNPESSLAPYRIFNVGNRKPIALMDFIHALERSLGKVAIKKYLPTPPGDVLATAANTEALLDWVDFMPQTDIQEGIDAFVDWYRVWHRA